MLKHKLVDFIIQFMEEVDKEISEMKLFVCSFPIHLSSTTLFRTCNLNLLSTRPNADIHVTKIAQCQGEIRC